MNESAFACGFFNLHPLNVGSSASSFESKHQVSPDETSSKEALALNNRNVRDNHSGLVVYLMSIKRTLPDECSYMCVISDMTLLSRPPL
jgi:hypothetical protein